MWTDIMQANCKTEDTKWIIFKHGEIAFNTSNFACYTLSYWDNLNIQAHWLRKQIWCKIQLHRFTWYNEFSRILCSWKNLMKNCLLIHQHQNYIKEVLARNLSLYCLHHVTCTIKHLCQCILWKLHCSPYNQITIIYHLILSLKEEEGVMSYENKLLVISMNFPSIAPSSHYKTYLMVNWHSSGPFNVKWFSIKLIMNRIYLFVLNYNKKRITSVYRNETEIFWNWRCKIQLFSVPHFDVNFIIYFFWGRIIKTILMHKIHIIIIDWMCILFHEQGICNIAFSTNKHKLIIHTRYPLHVFFSLFHLTFINCCWR